MNLNKFNLYRIKYDAEQDKFGNKLYFSITYIKYYILCELSLLYSVVLLNNNYDTVNSDEYHLIILCTMYYYTIFYKLAYFTL